MIHQDPVIAQCGSEVLRVMHEKRIGVSMALFHIITQRELYSASLFDAVKKAVIDLIDESEELRNMIVAQLKTERGTLPPLKPTTPIKRYTSSAAASAEALEKKEEGGQMTFL